MYLSERRAGQIKGRTHAAFLVSRARFFFILFFFLSGGFWFIPERCLLVDPLDFSWQEVWKVPWLEIVSGFGFDGAVVVAIQSTDEQRRV